MSNSPRWAHSSRINEQIYLISTPHKLENPVASSVIRNFRFRRSKNGLN